MLKSIEFHSELSEQLPAFFHFPVKDRFGQFGVFQVALGKMEHPDFLRTRFSGDNACLIGGEVAGVRGALAVLLQKVAFNKKGFDFFRQIKGFLKVFPG